METNRTIVREIEARELAEELLGGCVVGERGFYWGFKASKVDDLTLVSNPYLEFVSTRGPTNPFGERSGTIDAHIPCVLQSRRNPQIVFLIVEPVAVFVINAHAITRTADNEMMQKHATQPFPCLVHLVHSIETSSARASVPRQQSSPVEISIINKRDVPARKWDFTHG